MSKPEQAPASTQDILDAIAGPDPGGHQLLAGYKLIPLSGAQLVNTDETLAILGTTNGDIPQRRRIEIRLRKSVPRDATAGVTPASMIGPPRPRPVARPPLFPAPRVFAAPPS
jgi:hypothetical protein